MYITCEQCSTIFRLDENLLKPTGSKVRCSQCRNVFVAKPPDTFEDHLDDSDTQGETPDPYQESPDRELEGIDVAELDSIMEEGRTEELVAELADQDGADEVDLLAAFDEADLDMDFESALEKEDGELKAAVDTTVDPEVQDITEPMDEIGENLDFDMDFELDDWDEELIKSAEESEDDDLDIAMDMDFELEGGAENAGDKDLPEANIPEEPEDLIEETMLDENVELALDDFEDVLGDAEAMDEEDFPSVDSSDTEELDLGPDESGAVGLGDLDSLLDDAEDITAGVSPEADSELGDADDLDLSGLDAFLNEEDDALDSGGIPEDVELTLDGDIALDSEAALDESGLPATAEGEDDDLGLAELDEVLDEVDDTPGAAALAEDDNLSLDEDFELSLDDDLTADTAAHESDIMLSADEEDDDLDLADLGDLLAEDDDAPGVAAFGDDDLSLGDELGLSLDDDLTVDAAADASTDSDDGDLDLADLDGLLDEDDDTPAAAASGDDELSLGDELELSLDDDLSVDAAADETDTDDDLNLADLDDLLDGDDDTPTAAVSGDDDLSLGDELELSLDEDLTVDAAADETDIGDDDFDIADLDGLLDGDEEATAALKVDDELSLGDEELDLTMDVESDSEIDEKTQLVEGTDDHDELDLSDFESLLGDDAITAESQADLSDSDDDLDLDGLLDDDASLEDNEPDGLELSLDDDFELSLDDESSIEEHADASAQLVSPEDDGDDLDLSGLEETMLVENEIDKPDDAAEEMDLSLEDDMQLSLDDDVVADTETADDFGELEDLEFELDAEFEDKPIAQTAEDTESDLILEDDQQDEAMDLSDIEKMLEDDTIVPDKADASEGAGFDLEASGAEKWANETNDDLGLDDDEIDLSEIEEAIDAVDGAEPDDIFVDESQEQELELDLDLEEDEPQSDDLPEALELEMEDDDEPTVLQEDAADDDDSSDLSDFDLSVEEDQPTVETETIDGGDIQLEFQIEESSGITQDPETISAAETTAAAASATTGFMEDEETFSGEETIAAEPVQKQPEIGMAPAPKKEGGRKSLIVIPIVLLLAVAGYFGYDYTVKNDIRIPFVTDYLNPQPKDPSGVLQLATMEINSKFIENEATGRLFVITGKVRNGYTIARKLIRLRGKLYTKGKVLVKTEHTFAGLVMADQELSSSAMEDIKKRLNTTAGQDLAITLEAGKSAPFMVVFTELPADLDEFVIELVSSIKAQ